MAPLNDLVWGAKDAEQRVERDVFSRVECGARYLNVSAWHIQHGQYQDGLDAAAESMDWLRSFAEIFPKPLGWADLRHAAAYYNAGVVFWAWRMPGEMAEVLGTADEWLARVQDKHRDSVSYTNVTAAMAGLRALV